MTARPQRRDGAALGACVAEAVRWWRFPAPEGGAVTVNYPLDLGVDDP